MRTTALGTPDFLQNKKGIFLQINVCSLQKMRFPENHKLVIYFSLTTPPPQLADKPPGGPTRERLISVHFGSVWLRFGSVWLRLAPFRVCFGSVSGPFRGVGWGRGGVGVGSGRGAFAREKNITITSVSQRTLP